MVLSKNFVNFELNKAIILYRSKLLKKIVNFRREDSRIGPVAMIDTNLIKNIPLPKGFEPSGF